MKISSKNTRDVDWFRSVSSVIASGCWIWTRYRIRDGYGRLTLNGRQVLAHRMVMHVSGGMTSKQFEDPVTIVMHTCDQPACVNPEHLRIGSQQDNIRDRDTKGRTAKHLKRRDKQGRFN